MADALGQIIGRVGLAERSRPALGIADARGTAAVGKNSEMPLAAAPYGDVMFGDAFVFSLRALPDDGGDRCFAAGPDLACGRGMSAHVIVVVRPCLESRSSRCRLTGGSGRPAA